MGTGDELNPLFIPSFFNLVSYRMIIMFEKWGDGFIALIPGAPLLVLLKTRGPRNHADQEIPFNNSGL